MESSSVLLSNTYYALRHGISLANEEKIIVSTPDNGLTGYGLSEKGIAQLKANFESIKPVILTNLIIVSSDFLRAKETAELFQTYFKGELIFDKRLRERNFGKLELQKNDFYHKVWEHDIISEMHCYAECEPLFNLRERLLDLIDNLESRFVKKKIALVSHGDCLQTLQTVFDGISPRKHRDLEPIETGELRQLNHKNKP